MSFNQEIEDIYYQAMLARDYRFDGKFFVGVKTTGIYCRPICPAKPKRENVIFFAHALAAERAGYRPCLRCHPEAAPDHPSWSGQSVLVQRALQLIASEEGPLLQEADYAAHLGVSARHLRRLFQAELGQSPKQIAQNRRLNFARKLVVETRLPLLTVAMSAGFGSLRRFNTAFKERFKRPPSAWRKSEALIRDRSAASEALELTLSYRPPYHWDSLLNFLARHQIAGPERVLDGVYERCFRSAEGCGLVQVQFDPEHSCLRVRIHGAEPRDLSRLVHRVRRLFDLDSDPLLVANVFAQVPLLEALWQSCPGVRLPGCWEPFETAVSIVLGQMVSLPRAQALNAELVARYGETHVHPLSGEPLKLFPQAETLAALSELQLGTTQKRRETVLHLARAVASGALSLSQAQDPQSFRKQLLALPGIGPWTAELMALRVLGDTDAFPASDLILKRALQHPEFSFEPDLSGLSPWRAYAAMALWQTEINKNQA